MPWRNRSTSGAGMGDRLTSISSLDNKRRVRAAGTLALALALAGTVWTEACAGGMGTVIGSPAVTVPSSFNSVIMQPPRMTAPSVPIPGPPVPVPQPPPGSFSAVQPRAGGAALPAPQPPSRVGQIHPDAAILPSPQPPSPSSVATTGSTNSGQYTGWGGDFGPRAGDSPTIYNPASYAAASTAASGCPIAPYPSAGYPSAASRTSPAPQAPPIASSCTNTAQFR